MTSIQAPSRALAPLRTTLDNGVVVLAQESHAVPTIAVNATFLAGSLHDCGNSPGVAYLTRRTIDRGTLNRSADDIAATLDDRGVSLRTSLTRHTLSLSCVCLPEDFDEVLTLVADIARHPAFPEVEVEKQRQEAITSIREDQDDPARAAYDTLLELLYGSQHPYGRPFKGTVGTLETITRAQLVDFHRRRLTPSSLKLAIAGDVSAIGALSSAERAFAAWRSAASGHEPVAPPPDQLTRRIRAVDIPGKSQADIAYGFLAIRRLDPRYYAYWMMNNILGQFGLGGRLAENIRERQGMAYYAYSTLEAAEGEGALVIHAGVAPENVGRTIDAIDGEVRRLCVEGPTPEELDETRESLIGAIPRMLETHESIAEFLIYGERFGLGLDYDRHLPELLQQVSMNDVREAASHILNPARAAIAIAGPVS
jgi:zinc protease